MNPSSTLRVRRAIALVFLLWGGVSVLLSFSVFGERAAQQISFPFVDTRLGSAAVVVAVSPAASETLSRGEFLLEVDGVPYFEVLGRTDEFLVEGQPNRYRIANPDGVERVVELVPEPIAWGLPPMIKLAHLGLILVALIYLLTGGAAFYLKPDRTDSWALLLFCSVMAIASSSVTSQIVV